MRPTSLDNYIGLELELLCDEVDELKDYIRKNKLDTNFQVGSDNSISTEVAPHSILERIKEHRRRRDDFYGRGLYHSGGAEEKEMYKLQRQIKHKDQAELRVLIPEHNREHYFNELSKLFKSQNFYVNDSCGFHVHLDMRCRNKVKALELLFSNLDKLKKEVDPSRLTNKYCTLNKSKSVRSQLLSKNKYRAINTASLKEHGTIEVRLHEGTVDINKIKSWVDKLIKIVTPANLGKTG